MPWWLKEPGHQQAWYWPPSPSPASEELMSWCRDMETLSASLALCEGNPLVTVDCLNSLRPRRDGRHFADDIFKCVFFNENGRISLRISLKFVPKGPINNNPALVQIMAWRRPGDKSLSEPMMVCLPTHICVTRPQWVNKGPVMSSFDVLFYVSLNKLFNKQLCCQWFEMPWYPGVHTLERKLVH